MSVCLSVCLSAKATKFLQSDNNINPVSATRGLEKWDFKETLTCDPEISEQCFTCNEGRCNTVLLCNNLKTS